jgi:hypothetical protein
MQLRPGVDAPRRRHQGRQQVELQAGESQHAAGDEDRPACGVHPDRCVCTSGERGDLVRRLVVAQPVMSEHQGAEDGGAVGHLVGGDDSGVDGHIAHYNTR